MRRLTLLIKREIDPIPLHDTPERQPDKQENSRPRGLNADQLKTGAPQTRKGANSTRPTSDKGRKGGDEIEGRSWPHSEKEVRLKKRKENSLVNQNAKKSLRRPYCRTSSTWNSRKERKSIRDLMKGGKGIAFGSTENQKVRPNVKGGLCKPDGKGGVKREHGIIGLCHNIERKEKRSER